MRSSDSYLNIDKAWLAVRLVGDFTGRGLNMSMAATVTMAGQMTQPSGVIISQGDSLAMLTDRRACHGSYLFDIYIYYVFNRI